VEIFLVRHGESEHNLERRVQGWSGTGLTERGRADARTAGDALCARGVAAVYGSDLARAAETAVIVGKSLGVAPILSADFREIRMGPWEGRLVDEVEANDGDALWKWRWDGRKPPYPDVESIDVFVRRMLDGLERICRAHDAADRVAVVTHGGSISVLMTHFTGLELIRIWQMPVENGSFSRVRWDAPDADGTAGKFTGLSWNETGHLLPKSTPGFNTLG
jgi:2,3-bisphosphoglycerate-dependent phosphoglycerate mutase